MARKPSSDAKWIDPDAVAAGDKAAPEAEAGAADRETEVDRFHNQSLPTPEDLMTALTDLQATIAALDARVAALEGGEASALGLTRRLGLDVVEMGGALSRRLQTLERQAAAPIVEAPPPPAEPSLFIARPGAPKRNVRLLAISVGMLVALIVVLAGAWALQFYNVRTLRPAATSRPAARVIDPGAVTIAPAEVSKPALATAPPAAVRRRPVRDTNNPEEGDDASAAPIGHVLYNAATPPPKP